ncbi:unnamed protein product [Closterium sp. NIES-64]|nr:unnamed protein product [Closterium sp. NIES-64]
MGVLRQRVRVLGVLRLGVLRLGVLVLGVLLLGVVTLGVLRVLVAEVLEVLLELLALEVLEVLLLMEALEVEVLEVLELLVLEVLVLEVLELLVLEVLVLEVLELPVPEVLVLEVLELLVLGVLILEVLELPGQVVLEVLEELPELLALEVLKVLLVLEALKLEVSEVLEVLEVLEQVVLEVLEVLEVPEVLLEPLTLEVLEVLLVLEVLALPELVVLRMLEVLLELLVLEVLELLVLEELELLVLPLADCTHGMALRPSSVPQRVVLPEPPASSFPHVPDLESNLARATSPIVTRLLATVVTHPNFESTAAFALVTELVDFAARSCLDYVASLVTESESVYPPSVGGEPALGCDALEDRQSELECLAVALPPFTSMLLCPEGDPDALDIPTPRSYREAILAQRDYELHSLHFSTAFLLNSLREAIWLHRLEGFTESFPAGTQWSLRRPVYGLCQAPGKWHDTLRTILEALGFSPSSADPSLFLRTDNTLPPFYVLVYVADLVFATADTEALALVKAEL